MEQPAASEHNTESPTIILGVRTDADFRLRVESLSGEKVMQCYQCGECTAGCPMAFAMDLMPNQVLRMVQLGVSKPVLESSTIWLCAGCETCAARCPRLVSLSKIMDALRQIALSEGKARERNVARFHKIFIDAVARDGRVHEVGMLARYKMAARDLFSDMGLGLRMFLKGKLKLMPDKIKGVDEVRRLIRDTTETPPHPSPKRGGSAAPPPSRRGLGGG
ncbi:MAG: 4Fe-4S dicluster domain-containing protein [Armatimonadota bacterium]|nr:4Fe-4S dicluster domain-containing protein [Armatimonadota bacterium]